MYVFLYNTIKWPYQPKHSPSYENNVNFCSEVATLYCCKWNTVDNVIVMLQLFRLHDENESYYICLIQFLLISFKIATISIFLFFLVMCLICVKSSFSNYSTYVILHFVETIEHNRSSVDRMTKM